MKTRLLFNLLLTLAGVSLCAEGQLDLITQPSGAEIHILKPGDSKMTFLGYSPLYNLIMEEGVYKVQLRKQDYLRLTLEDITIFPGGHKRVDKALIHQYAYFNLVTFPQQSTIYMDKVNLGLSNYENKLVLPGEYQFKVVPKDSLFKPSHTSIKLARNDSIFTKITHLYRSKTFEREHLSLPPWHLQVESGFQSRKYTGLYKTTKTNPECLNSSPTYCNLPKEQGRDSNFTSQEIKTRYDLPFTIRLAIPQNIEFHLHLPITYNSQSPDSSGFMGQGDLKMGVKYTMRKIHAGVNVSYTMGTGNSQIKNGQGYNSLALSIMGMAYKKAFQVFGNLTYQANFTPINQPQRNKGDELQGYLQAGYLIHPFMPYLSLDGNLIFSDIDNGNVPLDNGGYLFIPEAGLIIDVSESLGLQLGIPFSLFGKNQMKSWGIHLSFSFNINVG